VAEVTKGTTPHFFETSFSWQKYKSWDQMPTPRALIIPALGEAQGAPAKRTWPALKARFKAAMKEAVGLQHEVPSISEKNDVANDKRFSGVPEPVASTLTALAVFLHFPTLTPILETAKAVRSPHGVACTSLKRGVNERPAPPRSLTSANSITL